MDEYLLRKRYPTATNTRFLNAQQTSDSLLRDTYRRSNFCLLSHLQGIIHLNAEVAHGALQLGMTHAYPVDTQGHYR